MLGFFVVHLGEIQPPLRLQGRVPVRQQVRCSPRNYLGPQLQDVFSEEINVVWRYLAPFEHLPDRDHILPDHATKEA